MQTQTPNIVLRDQVECKDEPRIVPPPKTQARFSLPPQVLERQGKGIVVPPPERSVPGQLVHPSRATEWVEDDSAVCSGREAILVYTILVVRILWGSYGNGSPT